RELLERVEGFGVVGLLLEDLLPERDGVGVPVQPLSGEPGELQAVREARARIAGEPRFLREHVEEMAPRALLPVDLLELRERGPVVRLELDDPFEGLRRL